MQQHVPHLDESISASPALSPETESKTRKTLLRIIIEPDHISEGRIQPSAVQLRDLTQRGLSVHRREYTTEQEMKTAAQALTERTTAAGRRRLEGLSSFTAGAVRGIRNLELQAFVVIDTSPAGQHGPRFHISGKSTDEPEPSKRDEGAIAPTDGQQTHTGTGVCREVGQTTKK